MEERASPALEAPELGQTVRGDHQGAPVPDGREDLLGDPFRPRGHGVEGLANDPRPGAGELKPPIGQQVALHHARADRGDADALAVQLHGQGLGQAHDGELCGGVGRREGEPHQPGRRGHVYQVGGRALIQHPGDEGVDAVDDAPQVDLDGALPVLPREALHRRGHQDPHPVLQHVHPRFALKDVSRQRLHLLAAGAVDDVADGNGLQRYSLIAHRLQALWVNVHQVQPGSFAGKGQRRGPADPGSGAGDHHHLVFKVAHYSISEVNLIMLYNGPYPGNRDRKSHPLQGRRASWDLDRVIG